MAVDLGLVADVATTLAVLGALAFGVVQVRQFERKRREAATIELMHSLQNPDFLRAFRAVKEMPDGMSPEEFRALGPEAAEAAHHVVSVFETVGLLVFHRSVPIEVAEDMFGGMVREAWKKLSPYAELRRRQSGTGKPLEWTQWLAERLEERKDAAKDAGAHVRHRSWRA